MQDGQSWLIAVLTGALVVSLAAHGLRSTTETIDAPQDAPLTAHPPECPPPPTTDVEARAELDACRAESWALVGKVIAAETQPRRRPPAIREPIEIQARRHALCEVALAHTGAHWDRSRTEIMKLATETTPDAWLAEQQSRFETTLGPAAGRLKDRYAARMRPLLEKAARAARDEDAVRLYKLARALFATEDAVVAEVLGPEARDTVRAEATTARTTVLALLGRYADAEWDDALAW